LKYVHGALFSAQCAFREDLFMDRASDSINAIRMLRELAEALAEARTEEETCQLAIAVFQKNQKKAADLPFVLIYLLDEDGCQARLCGVAGLSPDSPAAPLQVDLQAEPEGWPLAQVAQTGKLKQVDDQERIGLLTGNDSSQGPIAETVLVLPVARAGQQHLYGMLVVGINPHCWQDEDYQDFCFLVADQIACALANVENAHLYQQSQEAIQMRDELLATVSHDLKNPLGAIKGYTTTLAALREA
jgi:K+-sensing histidine kinase KdpD